MKQALHFSSPFLLSILLLLPLSDASAKRRKIQGFDVSNASIPVNKIISGGVGKNAIPSINRPRFIQVDEVDFLYDNDQVVSVTSGGETRAYPIRILDHHEVVNDSIGEDHFAVTYCPLCGTAMVFDRKIGTELKFFGVSGLLYNSDVLMYDRETESLWSQLGMKAVAGPMLDTTLKWRNSAMMKWEAWKARYPDGEVLSTKTGFSREYGDNAYTEYRRSRSTMFPVPTYRKDLKQKEWVFGIIVGGRPKAYQAAHFPVGRNLSDVVNGKNIVLHLDPQSHEFKVQDLATGEAIPSVLVYWFAWQAFYPETEVLGKLRKTREKK